MEELRVIFYPVVMDGQVREKMGIFRVTFADGLPVRARMPRFVSFDKITELVEFYDEVEAAILDKESLHVRAVLDLDNVEWDGTLVLEREAILI